MHDDKVISALSLMMHAMMIKLSVQFNDDKVISASSLHNDACNDDKVISTSCGVK